MHKVHNTRRLAWRNPDQLDLFYDLRARELRSVSRQVRHLATKHHLSTSHALAIAMAAGLVDDI